MTATENKGNHRSTLKNSASKGEYRLRGHYNIMTKVKIKM